MAGLGGGRKQRSVSHGRAKLLMVPPLEHIPLLNSAAVFQKYDTAALLSLVWLGVAVVWKNSASFPEYNCTPVALFWRVGEVTEEQGDIPREQSHDLFSTPLSTVMTTTYSGNCYYVTVHCQCYTSNSRIPRRRASFANTPRRKLL